MDYLVAAIKLSYEEVFCRFEVFLSYKLSSDYIEKRKNN